MVRKLASAVLMALFPGLTRGAVLLLAGNSTIRWVRIGKKGNLYVRRRRPSGRAFLGADAVK
jgi:hypothetical protein